MLWDRCIELGIETRKKLRELARHYERSGAGAQEQWFFDPFVPDVVTIRGSKLTKDVDERPLGRPADRAAQARAAMLDVRSEAHLARLPRATPTATRWWTRTS